MNAVYRISQWASTFETADSRKHKSLSWVSLPIDRQSNGYQSLIDHFGDEAAAIYGAWCVLVGIAASCPERGTLACSRGNGMSITRIARMAHMPESVFKKLFEWAIREEIGWLETVVDATEKPQPVDDQSSTSQQLVDNQSPIGLPNLTLPYPTLPHTASIKIDDVGVEEVSDGDSESKPESRVDVEKKTLQASDSPRGGSQGFDRFWEVVHLKTGKRAAEKAFEQAVKRVKKEQGVTTIEAAGFIIGRMVKFSKSPKANPSDHSPIHPSTWLNQGRYDDDISTWMGGVGVGAGQTFSATASFGDGF